MAIIIRRPPIHQGRIQQFFLVVAFFYVCLVLRLGWLQIANGNFYGSLAASMRSRTIDVIAPRGDVVDRNDKQLAITARTAQLVCDPTLIKNAGATIASLNGILINPPADLATRLTVTYNKKNKPLQHVVLVEHLETAEIEKLAAARINKKISPTLAGIVLEDKLTRVNTQGQLAVHVVGITVPDADGRPKGVMGVEKTCQTVLHGEDGQQIYEVDARRRPIPDTQHLIKEKIDGRNVRLTIDANIQRIAEQELAKCCEKFQPTGATVIIMDPATGDVLAMASWPNFDPANRDSIKSALSDPLQNHALSLYEPGSTVKAITAAQAIDTHAITLTETFTCNGPRQIGSRYVKCATHHGAVGVHGTQTVDGVIAESCNVCTAMIGLQLGSERMLQGLRNFKLMDNTGVGLPSDNHGRVALDGTREKLSITTLGRVAFGQSFMATPLGMTSAYCALAFGGIQMKPRLIEAYLDNSGHVVEEFATQQWGVAVKPETAKIMTSILEGVVTHGTGKDCATVPGYRVAGKTGTAQRVDPLTHQYSSTNFVASFIGYLPASHPRVVINVLVDSPKGAQFGSMVAAPPFKQIAERVMAYLHVTPDDPASMNTITKADTKTETKSETKATQGL
ncbi:MAG: penicillin-binding protein 2 [Chthonomonadales bacterium]